MEDNKTIGRTTQCIVCLNKAINYTGHLSKGDNMVLAGWCDEHIDVIIQDGKNNTKILFLMNTIGCYGGWHEKYGYEEQKI